jgi:hypothetical protein
MGVGLSKDGKPLSEPSSTAPVGVALNGDSNVTNAAAEAENVLKTVDEKATKVIDSLESVGSSVPNEIPVPEVVVADIKSDSAPIAVVGKDVVHSSIADVAEKSHAAVDSKISLPAVEDIPNKVPEINVDSSSPPVDSKIGSKPLTELSSPGNELKKSKASPSIGASFISLFRRNYSDREPATASDAFKTSSAFHDVEVMPAANSSKTSASQSSSAPAGISAAVDEKIAAVSAVTVDKLSASSTVLALDTGIETKDEADHIPNAADVIALSTTIVATDEDDIIAHVKDESAHAKNDTANVKDNVIAHAKDIVIAPVTAPVNDIVIAPVTAPVTAAVKDIAIAPVSAAVKDIVTTPVKDIVIAPVTAPVKDIVIAPVTAPVTAAVKDIVIAPVTAPVTAAVKDIVTAPVTAAVKDIAIAPVSAAVKDIVTTPVKDIVIAPVTAPVTATVKDIAIAPVTAPVTAAVKDEVTAQPAARGLLSRSKSTESANCCGGRGKDLSQAVYLPVASDQNKEIVTDGPEIDASGDNDEVKRSIIEHVDEGEEKSEKLLAASALRPVNPSSVLSAPIVVPGLLAAHTAVSGDAKKVIESSVVNATSLLSGAEKGAERGISLNTSALVVPGNDLEVIANRSTPTESVDDNSPVSVAGEDDDADVDYDEKNDVCANFEIDHHQLTRISYKAKTDWWNAETESNNR